MAFRELAGISHCRCCGHRIKPGFNVCLGCERKRRKVLDDCIAAGKSVEWSIAKVDEVYPERFNDLGAPIVEH